MNISIEDIKNLVIEGKLEPAIENIYHGSLNSDFEIEATNLYARFNSIQKKKLLGIISYEDEQISTNEIRVELLLLLDKVNDYFFFEIVSYEALKFFESATSSEYPIVESKVYKDTFISKQVRHLMWEMNLRFPKTSSNFSYKLKWHIIKPDGSITAPVISDLIIEKGWDYCWLAASWGSNDYGTWQQGKSIFEIFINNKKIQTGEVTFL